MRIGALLLVAALGCSGEETPAGRLFKGKPLEYWAVQLEDLDPKRSDEAVEALVAFGPEALPHLAAAFGDAKPSIAENAARALHGIACREPGEKGVAPAVVMAARSPSFHVRYWAARTLGEMRPPPPEARETLLLLQEDPAETVREMAKAKLRELR